MSDASTDTVTEVPKAETGDMKPEVVTRPVSNVDRAKRLYRCLGRRFDADMVVGDRFRSLQLTSWQAQGSIAFEKGLTTAVPGCAQRSLIVVADTNAARADLVGRGVEVGEVFHLDGGPLPSPDPEGCSHHTYASFSDPRRQRVAAPGKQDAAPGSRVE